MVVYGKIYLKVFINHICANAVGCGTRYPLDIQVTLLNDQLIWL